MTLVRTELLSIGVDEVRELVRRAAMSPTIGRWQVIVVEDADRVTERGADALLKSIEEPAPRTVWILCAPNPDDVVATIRSRCRLLRLQTPSVAAVAELLRTRDGIEPDLAAYAARIAQGHVGRARALARDEEARNRRAEVLRDPVAAEGSRRVPDRRGDARRGVLDGGGRGHGRARRPGAGGAGGGAGFRHEGGPAAPGTRRRMKDLEDQQKARAKRFQRDAIDRALTELTGYYRDVLSVQTGSGAELVNADLSAQIAVLARKSSPESTLRRIDALLGCRTALEGNVAPLLAVESTLIALVEG